MKYIRTKQGHIYKRLYKDGALNRGVGYIIQGAIMPFGEDVIKESDTIEELCDEFIDTSELKTTNTGGWLYDEFDSKNKCLIYYVEDEIRTIPLNEFEDLSKIYGAIWTKEGLIYVAKMNKKGKFKLL